MKRRLFCMLAAAAALPLPPRASAQGQLRALVGFLHGSAPTGPYPGYVARFIGGLKEQGFELGRDVTVEYRWAKGHYHRIPELTAELLALGPAVMVTYGPPNVVKAAIDAIPRTIPVVFGTGGDPIRAGIVSNFAHPPEHITGVANRTNDLDVKRLELLRDLLPEVTTIGLIVNPKNSDAAGVVEAAQAGAQSLGRHLVVSGGSTMEQLASAFDEMKAAGAGAVLIGSDTYFVARSDRIVALAAAYRLPAMYSARAYIEAGGLASYGADFGDNYRLIGIDVGKILNGTRPADIPVVEPVRFKLVINLKTAGALGLTVPQPLLARADEVIE